MKQIPYMTHDISQQVELHRATVELMDRIRNDESIPHHNELTFDQALSIVSTARITGAINHLADVCDKLDANRVQDNY